MKKILLTAFLLGSAFIFAQKNKLEFIYLERFSVSSNTFKGTIASKPITVHLKFVDLAGSQMGNDEYFVKGWYYYDHIKKPIKLIGFYQFGDYTLYHFKNEKDKKNYETVRYYSLEKQDSLALKNKVTEIIKFNFDEYSDKPYTSLKGKYFGNNKILKTKLLTDDGNIFYDYELIKLPNGKVYNTRKIIPDYPGNILKSCTIGKSENRILLEFNHLSNPRGRGACYADIDKGYRMLTFDKNWNFKKVESYETYSCELPKESYEINTNNKNIKKYYIKEFEEKYYLTIDFENSTITKKSK